MFIPAKIQLTSFHGKYVTEMSELLYLVTNIPLRPTCISLFNVLFISKVPCDHEKFDKTAYELLRAKRERVLRIIHTVIKNITIIIKNPLYS